MKKIKWIFAFSTIMASALVTIAGPRLAARAGSQPTVATAAGAAVQIDNFSFGPDVTIPAGTTVTWTNHDDVPHVVASDSNIFKSKALDTEDRFSFTFNKPGTYVYHCTVHPRMTAKVIVQ